MLQNYLTNLQNQYNFNSAHIVALKKLIEEGIKDNINVNFSFAIIKIARSGGI